MLRSARTQRSDPLHEHTPTEAPAPPEDSSRGAVRRTRGRHNSGVLPTLIDLRGLREEMGVSEATAEAIARHLPTIRIPGHRRRYLRRADITAFLSDCTTLPEL